MSTILDALRKLQRERSAAHPSRDLRGSVTDEIPFPRPARRSSRRGLALAGIVLLLAAAGGGAWLYRSGKLARFAGGQQVAAPAVAGAKNPAEGEAALEQMEREAAATDAEMDRATAAEAEAPAAVAASPTPAEPAPAPAIDPEAEARAERDRLEAAQAEAVAAANTQREAELEAAARANPPAPPPPSVPVPLPAATANPAPESAAAVPSVPPAAAPPTAAAATPAPAPKPKAKPRPKPTPKAETAASESARRDEPAKYGDDPAAAAVTPFPPVRVESIRWHPISERRVATLRFEQQNVADAHEGDIVGGVLVYRIDPGAVEIRVGSTSRVIRPTP